MCCHGNHAWTWWLLWTTQKCVQYLCTSMWVASSEPDLTTSRLFRVGYIMQWELFQTTCSQHLRTIEAKCSSRNSDYHRWHLFSSYCQYGVTFRMLCGAKWQAYWTFNIMFVHHKWCHMLTMSDVICWPWVMSYVDHEWCHMLTMSDVICWPWVMLYVDHEWCYMLTMSDVIC